MDAIDFMFSLQASLEGKADVFVPGWAPPPAVSLQAIQNENGRVGANRL